MAKDKDEGKVLMEEVLKRLGIAEKQAENAEKRAAEAETLVGKLQAIGPKKRPRLEPRVPRGTSDWKKIEGENYKTKQGQVAKLDKDKMLVGYKETKQYNKDGSYNPDVYVRLAPVKK